MKTFAFSAFLTFKKFKKKLNRDKGISEQGFSN
jgi:hypothetical protein